MLQRFTVFILTALLAACGGESLAPLAPGSTILAFGDSLTFGTGAGAGQGYPSVLENLTDLPVVNAGIPGEVSDRGRERLPALLAEHRPGLVVLVHGGNDTLRNLPPSRTRQNLLSMIESSHASGAQVVMLGVPGRNLTLSAPDYYAEVAEETGVPIDLRTLPRLMRDGSMKSDQVHFNAEGYRRMAEAVLELIREAGALP